MIDLSLNTVILENGWADLPESIITRERLLVDTSSDTWHLPCPTERNSSAEFCKIQNHCLRWCLKKYVQDRLQFTSTHAGFMAYRTVWSEFLMSQEKYEINESVSIQNLKDNLIRLVEDAISEARSKHRLWALYRPIQWYLWCSENYPELGFCPAYAMELEGMVIPGNPKGEAVRIEDNDKGPLHRSLELPLLLNALREDRSNEFLHLQQKAALALSLALGRNPANLTYLKISDLMNLSPEGQPPCYVIRMPRIKKRGLNPRDDLLDEYLEPQFAAFVLELIEANKSIPTTTVRNGSQVVVEKPLFINLEKNQSAIAAADLDNIFNMTSFDITHLIIGFVRRHKIVSPITGEPLQITTRRLRYTLATALAAEGISRAELARILDHTDTQHVQVYFELAGTIVEHLDKAMAKGFSKYLQLFRGTIIDSQEDATNAERDDKYLAFVSEVNPLDQTEIGICGEKSLCHLDPPFSCYLCPKFQPYRHADHEHVLDCLLLGRKERIEKYEQGRLGIQLDEVILAVAQVIEQCKGET